MKSPSSKYFTEENREGSKLFADAVTLRTSYFFSGAFV